MVDFALETAKKMLHLLGSGVNKGIVHAEESVRGVQLASLALVETATPT